MVSDVVVQSHCWVSLPVLILVVVEYGLGLPAGSYGNFIVGLNPCCSGIWSRTTMIYSVIHLQEKS